jgi:flagellar basal-body rod protein FlgB
MDSYELLKTTLSVSAKRAELISSNIANVNTDGYKAKRVEFESELKQALAASGTQSTDGQEDILSQVQPRVTQNSNTSLKDNGNNVDLEVEMLDQATNGLYYSALTAQINGRLQMMNYVLSN